MAANSAMKLLLPFSTPLSAATAFVLPSCHSSLRKFGQAIGEDRHETPVASLTDRELSWISSPKGKSRGRIVLLPVFLRTTKWEQLFPCSHNTIQCTYLKEFCFTFKNSKLLIDSIPYV